MFALVAGADGPHVHEEHNVDVQDSGDGQRQQQKKCVRHRADQLERHNADKHADKLTGRQREQLLERNIEQTFAAEQGDDEHDQQQVHEFCQNNEDTACQSFSKDSCARDTREIKRVLADDIDQHAEREKSGCRQQRFSGQWTQKSHRLTG